MQGNELFQKMLVEAVTVPGRVMSAYSNFHGYSLGNQLYALWQMHLRGITPGPIASYKSWKRMGRQVKKGEKAIALLMPVTSKRKTKDANGDEVEKYITIGRFIERNFWFALSQTFVPCKTCYGKGGTIGETPGEDKVCQPCKGTGSDLTALEFKNPDLPEFVFSQAYVTLNIREVPFDLTTGNVMGYAQSNKIAISPLNPLPHKTRFHEMAHILLGHTKDGAKIVDDATLVKSLREVEAESVAYLCISALGLDGQEFSRGYIQNWLGDAIIPQESAQKIFKVADTILKAGTNSLQKYQEQAA